MQGDADALTHISKIVQIYTLNENWMYEKCFFQYY